MKDSIVLASLKELAKGMNPVQIMHIINVLLKMMSCKVLDKNEPDWWLDHIEYDDDQDEIYFICDTRTIGGK